MSLAYHCVMNLEENPEKSFNFFFSKYSVQDQRIDKDDLYGGFAQMELVKDIEKVILNKERKDLISTWFMCGISERY